MKFREGNVSAKVLVITPGTVMRLTNEQAKDREGSVQLIGKPDSRTYTITNQIQFRRGERIEIAEEYFAKYIESQIVGPDVEVPTGKRTVVTTDSIRRDHPAIAAALIEEGRKIGYDEGAQIGFDEGHLIGFEEGKAAASDGGDGEKGGGKKTTKDNSTPAANLNPMAE